MKNIHTQWKSEQGYTLIETLTAFILLFIVVIPFTRVITFMISEKQTFNKIWAVTLAEREMETTLIQRQFVDEERQEMRGRQPYIIQKKISHENGLLKIQITILHPLKQKVLYQLFMVRRDD